MSIWEQFTIGSCAFGVFVKRHSDYMREAVIRDNNRERFLHFPPSLGVVFKLAVVVPRTKSNKTQATEQEEK